MRRTIIVITVAVIAVIAVIAGVVGFVVMREKLQSARRAALSQKCIGNLHRIQDELRLYHHRYGTLPPAYVSDDDGEPMHSWRVLILESWPEGGDVFREYDFSEPWDSPANQKLADRVQHYRCPDATTASEHETNYVVVVGDATAFPGARSVALDDIQRDLEEVVLVVEVENSGIHWMEPRDLPIEDLSLKQANSLSISGNHDTGAKVLWASGAKGSFLQPYTLDDLRRMVRINEEPGIRGNTPGATQRSRSSKKRGKDSR